MLYDILRNLNVIDNIDRLLEMILEQIFKEIEVDRAVIMLKNEATGAFDTRASKSRRERLEKETIRISRTIIDNVIDRGEAVLIKDAQYDSRFNPTESIVKMGIHSAMCVPLKTDGAIIGILYLDRLSHTDVYSGEDLEFIIAVCNQAAVSVKNARLFAEVRRTKKQVERTNEKLQQANQAYREANCRLEKAYVKLQETQEKLIQSEKLSSLG